MNFDSIKNSLRKWGQSRAQCLSNEGNQERNIFLTFGWVYRRYFEGETSSIYWDISVDPLFAKIRDTKIEMITSVNQVLFSRDGRNEWNCRTNARWWAAVLEWFTEQRSQAPFLRRKVVLGKRVTLLSELLLASQLFLHFHIKLGEPFKEKQKAGSTRGLTHLAGSPS